MQFEIGRKPAVRGRAFSTFFMMAAALLVLAGCQGSATTSGGGDRLNPKIVGQTSSALGDLFGSSEIPSPGYGVEVSEEGPVQIALLAPTGDARKPVAALAKSITDAARLALRDVGDPRLKLTVYDTRGTANGAAHAAAAAINGGASVILGPLFAESVTAVKPYAQQAGLTMLSFSTDTSVAGDNVFLLNFLVQQEIDRVVSYAVGQGLTSFAALSPHNTAKKVDAAMVAATSRNGARLLGSYSYDRSFQGIEQGVQSFAELHGPSEGVEPPQAVVLADDGQALQTLGAYLAYFDFSPQQVKFLGSGGWSDEGVFKERTLVGGWFAAPDPNVQEQFAARYRRALNNEPHPLASLGYDAVAAVAALADEARRAGDSYPFTPERLSTPAGFAGVNGIFRFTPQGLAQRGLAVIEVKEGAFEVVDQAPSSFTGY